MGRIDELVLIANARMPSPRAQSLQVAQAAAAFSRAGVRTSLWYARRAGDGFAPRERAPDADASRDTDAEGWPLSPALSLWDWYAVPSGERPSAQALACVDAIDRFPRRWQYLPARLQELSFAYGAARRARALAPGVVVLSREAETVTWMPRRAGVFLEVHRVPGGRARRRWLTRAAAHAAGVIAISGGVRDDLCALGVAAGSIHVEHDAYESARFVALPSRADARERLGLPGDRVVAVYTGGLLDWKGVDLIVEAAREVPDVQIVIAGGMDADVARLRARARGIANVRVDGFQAPSAVAAYLAAADLGVVPNRAQPAISARYTSPLKVFEAMAVGLPLVVSDLPSLREILSPQEAAFFQPDSVADLARALRELAQDGARRAALAECMRARAARHTWDARAERLLAWMGARL